MTRLHSKRVPCFKCIQFEKDLKERNLVEPNFESICMGTFKEEVECDFWRLDD